MSHGISYSGGPPHVCTAPHIGRVVGVRQPVVCPRVSGRSRHDGQSQNRGGVTSPSGDAENGGESLEDGHLDATFDDSRRDGVAGEPRVSWRSSLLMRRCLCFGNSKVWPWLRAGTIVQIRRREGVGGPPVSATAPADSSLGESGHFRLSTRAFARHTNSYCFSNVQPRMRQPGSILTNDAKRDDPSVTVFGIQPL